MSQSSSSFSTVGLGVALGGFGEQVFGIILAFCCEWDSLSSIFYRRLKFLFVWYTFYALNCICYRLIHVPAWLHVAEEGTVVCMCVCIGRRREEDVCVCAGCVRDERWDKKNTILLLCYAYVIKIAINSNLLSQSAFLKVP